MKRSSKELTTQNKNSVSQNSILTSLRKFSLINKSPINLTINYSPEKKEKRDSPKKNKIDKSINILPNQVRSELLDWVDKEIKTKIKKGDMIMDSNNDCQQFVIQDHNMTQRNSSKSTALSSISPTKCCSSKNSSSISLCSYNTIKIDYEKIMKNLTKTESKIVLLKPKQDEERRLYQYKLEAIADTRKMSLINSMKKGNHILIPSQSLAELGMKSNTIKNSLLELNPMQINFPSLDLNKQTIRQDKRKNTDTSKNRKKHNYTIQISSNK